MFGFQFICFANEILHELEMNKSIVNENKTKVIITVEENVAVIELPLSRESIVDLLQSISGSMSGTDGPVVQKPEYSSVVFVRSNLEHRKVMVRDISYLEAARNYCDIYLANGTRMNVTVPMNEVQAYFDPHVSKRVHRSFVVNLEHVNTYIGNQLSLGNNKKITIGREYREIVAKEFVCIGSRKRIRERANDNPGRKRR